MADTAVAILMVLVGYASGAVPWGVVLGRLVGRIDLRSHGSQSIGATNALRLLGWRVSLAVFLLDFAKGFIPVVIAQLLGFDGWWVAAVGVAAVVGHCWSPLIGFRGGKGMATGAGSAAGMFPWVLLVFPLMAIIVALTRYVSLASIVGSVVVSVVLVVLGIFGFVTWSVTLAVVTITTIILLKHEGNIRRLLSGTERRFGESASH